MSPGPALGALLSSPMQGPLAPPLGGWEGTGRSSWGAVAGRRRAVHTRNGFVPRGQPGLYLDMFAGGQGGGSTSLRWLGLAGEGGDGGINRPRGKGASSSATLGAPGAKGLPGDPAQWQCPPLLDSTSRRLGPSSGLGGHESPPGGHSPPLLRRGALSLGPTEIGWPSPLRPTSGLRRRGVREKELGAPSRRVAARSA